MSILNIDINLLNSLICPETKESLRLSDDGNFLVSEISGKTYSLLDGIPVFINEELSMPHVFNYVEHYTIDAKEFDYFDGRYGATKDDERRVREYIGKYISKSTKNILDVGSGSAWLAGKYCPDGISVVSLDISHDNAKKAMDKCPYPNHFAIVADAIKLPFADESFDCIIASEVIEHILKPEIFISELFRCLKKGGDLIITTPYKERLIYNLCIHCNKKTPQNAHIHSFDENKLSELLNSGNEIKSFKTFGNKALLHLRTYVVLKYLPFRLWKLIDGFFSIFINKKQHILFKYHKQ